MKILVFLSLLFLSSLAENVYIPPAKQNLTEFSRGLFEYFNLGLPTNLLTCFNETHSAHFFSLFPVLKDYADCIYYKNDLALMIVTHELKAYYLDLNSTFHCAFETDDFQLLMQETGLHFSNVDELIRALILKITQNPAAASKAIQLVIDAAIDGGYEEGGKELGKILDELTRARETADISIHALEWLTGIFMGFKLPSPTKLNAECFIRNIKSMEYLLGFYSAWTKTLKTNSPDQAFNATVAFFEQTGNSFLNGFGFDTWRCMVMSDDYQKFKSIAGFGLSPYDIVFDAQLFWYLNQTENTPRYIHLMEILDHSFEKNEYLLAGLAYSYFLAELKTL